MAETSFFWGGSTTGDAGAYSDDNFSDFIASIIHTDRTLDGILPNTLNKLATTNPSGTTIRVASGGAFVDGKLYLSTANVDHSVAAPGTGSNYYTIVLRKDFSAQTVRQVLLGPSASAYPTVTQSDGATWEILVSKIQITSGSVITITDSRTYCHFNTYVSAAMMENSAITVDKIATDAVTTIKIKDANVTDAKIDSVSAAKVTGFDTAVNVEIDQYHLTQKWGISFPLGNGADVIATGLHYGIEIPTNCVIDACRVLSLDGTSGSIVIDIWKSTWANIPAENADSITASAPPTLSSATKSEDTTLTGWTKAITAGDWLYINVDSATDVKSVILSITGHKT